MRKYKWLWAPSMLWVIEMLFLNHPWWPILCRFQKMQLLHRERVLSSLTNAIACLALLPGSDMTFDHWRFIWISKLRLCCNKGVYRNLKTSYKLYTEFYFFKTKIIKMHYITGFNSDIKVKMLFCNMTAN